MIASNDVMSIQPAFLEVTHLVNRDPSSGLGLFIKATFEGHHVITGMLEDAFCVCQMCFFILLVILQGTKEGSISSRIRRITPGDEVVAVGNRNVVSKRYIACHPCWCMRANRGQRRGVNVLRIAC